MTMRKCSTCKHYEPAPIWRKGWCRNPLLYAPQQNHLVGEDDLDCERGMGNYWKPGDESPGVDMGSERDANLPGSFRGYRPQIITSHAGQPIYSVSGSSGYNDDPLDDDVPPDGGPRIVQPDQDRQLDYYSDERYWTDYLRIALPILGVLLLLVLFWFWISSFFGDDGDDVVTGVGNGTPTELPLITASPATPGEAGITGTPQIVQTAPPQAPGGVQATATPAPEGPAGVIAPGAAVMVANTGGTGVNLRSDATTASDVVAVLTDGTVLTITGESIDAEGYVWWPVQSDLGEGYIVEDYIVPAE